MKPSTAHRVVARFAAEEIGASAPKQLLDDRLQEVAQRLRRLITRVRTQPDIPAQAIAQELTEVMQIAEGE